MLILYDKEKRSKEFDLLEPALDTSATKNLLLYTQQLLSRRGEVEAASLLERLDFRLFGATNFFKDKLFVLHALVTFEEYEYFRKIIEGTTNDDAAAKLAHLFESVTSAIAGLGTYMRFVTCQLDLSHPPIVRPVSNQALFTFSDSPKVTYEGLNFRSKTEIKVFEALVSKGLLVLPLPVAVMGSSKKHKEPDFVVCLKGKVGILEIHGDKWHPPETAAEEHERRREFTKLGVSVYEIFGADRCWNDPDGVVSDFIQALARA